MFINEIPVGTECTIVAGTDATGTVEFKSTVLKVSETSNKFIVVDVIKKDGKIINFGSIPTTISFVNPEDNRTYQFKNPIIKYYRELNAHIVSCNAGISPKNLRAAFRIEVGEKAEINFNGKMSNGYVKDISSNGMCVSSRDEIKGLSIGAEIKVYFDSSIVGRSYIYKCKVVRVCEDDRGFMNYGCTFVQPDKFNNQLINHLQRLSLQKTRGK